MKVDSPPKPAPKAPRAKPKYRKPAVRSCGSLPRIGWMQKGMVSIVLVGSVGRARGVMKDR